MPPTPPPTPSRPARSTMNAARQAVSVAAILIAISTAGQAWTTATQRAPSPVASEAMALAAQAARDYAAIQEAYIVPTVKAADDWNAELTRQALGSPEDPREEGTVRLPVDDPAAWARRSWRQDFCTYPGAPGQQPQADAPGKVTMAWLREQADQYATIKRTRPPVTCGAGQWVSPYRPDPIP